MFNFMKTAGLALLVVAGRSLAADVSIKNLESGFDSYFGLFKISSERLSSWFLGHTRRSAAHGASPRVRLVLPDWCPRARGFGTLLWPATLRMF